MTCCGPFYGNSRPDSNRTIKKSSNVSKVALRLRLKWQEDFWIIKLETLLPKGLNQEVNNVKSTITAFFSSLNSHLLHLGRK